MMWTLLSFGLVVILLGEFLAAVALANKYLRVSSDREREREIS